jgi:hypothetical protein
MAGNPTVHIGTWESYIVPKGSFQSRHVGKEARRKCGGMAVGLTHSRGVAGVMPGANVGSLEGVSSKVQRSDKALAVH